MGGKHSASRKEARLKNDALISGILNGNADSVHSNLDSGANANAVDEDGTPALFLAIEQKNNKIIVEKLLQSGANKEQTYNGQTPLQYALDLQRSDLIDILTPGQENKEEQRSGTPYLEPPRKTFIISTPHTNRHTGSNRPLTPMPGQKRSKPFFSGR